MSRPPEQLSLLSSGIAETAVLCRAIDQYRSHVLRKQASGEISHDRAGDLLILAERVRRRTVNYPRTGTMERDAFEAAYEMARA